LVLFEPHWQMTERPIPAQLPRFVKFSLASEGESYLQKTMLASPQSRC
jgi:hypothetical protein